jgi:hypothetical protein
MQPSLRLRCVNWRVWSHLAGNVLGRHRGGRAHGRLAGLALLRQKFGQRLAHSPPDMNLRASPEEVFAHDNNFAAFSRFLRRLCPLEASSPRQADWPLRHARREASRNYSK